MIRTLRICVFTLLWISAAALSAQTRPKVGSMRGPGDILRVAHR